jgi:hypothetical protein
MKITQTTLRKIIREELQEAYREMKPVAPSEPASRGQTPSRSPEEMKKEHDELLWGAYEAIRRDEHAGLTGAVGYIKRAAQIERQLGFKPGSLRWSGRGSAAPLKLSYGTRDTNYDDPREWMARYRKQRGVREDLEEMKGDLSPEFRKNLRGALENEQLFVYVRNAGIPMRDVNRRDFFNFLRARDLTTPEAIEDNRALIAGWLKKNR